MLCAVSVVNKGVDVLLASTIATAVTAATNAKDQAVVLIAPTRGSKLSMFINKMDRVGADFGMSIRKITLLAKLMAKACCPVLRTIAARSLRIQSRQLRNIPAAAPMMLRATVLDRSRRATAIAKIG